MGAVRYPVGKEGKVWDFAVNKQKCSFHLRISSYHTLLFKGIDSFQVIVLVQETRSCVWSHGSLVEWTKRFLVNFSIQLEVMCSSLFNCGFRCTVKSSLAAASIGRWYYGSKQWIFFSIWASEITADFFTCCNYLASHRKKIDALVWHQFEVSRLRPAYPWALLQLLHFGYLKP